MSVTAAELIKEIKLKDRTHLEIHEWAKRGHHGKKLKELKTLYQRYLISETPATSTSRESTGACSLRRSSQSSTRSVAGFA